MDRREMITLMAATTLAACASSRDNEPRSDVDTISYGADPSQFGELTRPSGSSHGVVVVIHGGFWRSAYDLSLGRPLAASLVEQGWTAYNLEYRRVGNGGGVPQTLDDVAAGIDALADARLDLSSVVTLGHSAGGQLAVWAAGRASPAVSVTAAIAQAGVLNLATAASDNLGNGATQAFLGSATAEQIAGADPSAQIPLDVPVRCIHGRADQVVPLTQSSSYVDQARAAGADAELTEVDGDHFVVIDPASKAWAQTLTILDKL